MGNLFSANRKQQEKNVVELTKAILTAVAVAFIIKADISSGMRSSLGFEFTVGATIVGMSVLWIEFAEPFEGVFKTVSGWFIESRHSR
jgi:hypothetical protein